MDSELNELMELHLGGDLSDHRIWSFSKSHIFPIYPSVLLFLLLAYFPSPLGWSGYQLHLSKSELLCGRGPLGKICTADRL